MADTVIVKPKGEHAAAGKNDFFLQENESPCTKSDLDISTSIKKIRKTFFENNKRKTAYRNSSSGKACISLTIII